MRPEFPPIQHRFLVVIIFATAGFTAVAKTEPMTPSKVRTITVGPQSAEDHQDTLPSPVKSPKFHIITVRPRLPEEQRDASDHPPPTTQEHGSATSDADRHVVRSTPIKPNPDATNTPDHHAVRTIRVPSQSPPQLER